MIVSDARQMLALRQQILALEAELKVLAGQSGMARRIQTVPGFGLVCGCELAGEIGSIARFAKTDSLAMYLGVAPLDNSSGKFKGSKVPRQVNRRARDAMMIAAVHHIAAVPASKAYFDKNRAAGKTHQQAVRVDAHMLARVLFSMLKNSKDYAIPVDLTEAKLSVDNVN